MKAAPGGLPAHLALVTTTIAECVKIKRRDGVILALTAHDQNLSINVDSDGAQTYLAALGFMPSQFEQSDDLRPGQAEIESALNAAGISEADLIAQRWDGATAKFFKVNWAASQPISDVIKLNSYTLGRVSRGDFKFQVELLDQVDAYGKSIIRTIQEKCDAELGDTRCGVQLTPAAWAAATVYAVGAIVRPTTYNGRRFICTVAGTSGGSEPAWNTTVGGSTTDNTVTWQTYQSFRKNGTVATVTSKADFTVSGIAAADAPDDWARLGTWKFTSGANNGLTREVLDWTGSTGRVQLLEAMPFTVAAADTGELTIGCDKNLTPTCKTTFNNVVNFRGFPYLPGRNKATEHV